MKGVALSVLGLALQPLLSAGAHRLDPKEWQLYELMGQLRAQGYECRAPDRSKVFPANPADYLFDCRLAEASKAHTIDMGTRGSLSHGGSDGSTPCDRAKRVGVDTCSENVCVTRGHPMEARIAYQGSFFHCQAMMNPHYNVVGVGVYYGKNPYPTYWAQLHHNANKVDSSCHPAPGAILAPPPYTTRAPGVVGSAVPLTGPLTLPPGYTLPPGVTLLPPDIVFATPAPPGSQPAPAPSPAPRPPAPPAAPAPAPAPVADSGDKGEKGGKGKDREGEFDENGSLDLKDRAATCPAPAKCFILGTALSALWS